jgi:hypothetical protein
MTEFFRDLTNRAVPRFNFVVPIPTNGRCTT